MKTSRVLTAVILLGLSASLLTGCGGLDPDFQREIACLEGGGNWNGEYCYQPGPTFFERMRLSRQ